MVFERPNNSDVDWESLRIGDENIRLHLSSGTPKHIAIIPREVLEDHLHARGVEPKQLALENKQIVQFAVTKAFQRGDWDEKVRIEDHYRVFLLWVTPQDFR